ncbi:type II secretion system F family protein [Patescibacteria group bacterium]
MKFNYQARSKEGQLQTGTIEAISKEGALNLLRKNDLYITFLEEATPPIYAKKIRIFERISRKDIVLFSRQLSIMFRSQVLLVEALETLASQTKNPDFKETILKLSEDVEGGTAFSKALSRHPKTFNSFYISMVKSGEVSGKLSEVLDYLADHLEREYYLISRIQGAMIYPALILLVVLVVIFLMIFFVIPQLTKILEATGQDLPIITRLVLIFSSFLRKWGILLFLGFIGMVISILRYIKTPEGEKRFAKNVLKLPLIGPFLKMVYLSRFAENLSTLISGGLPIGRALEISGEIVDNTIYKEIILQARDEVRKGKKISSVLKRYPEFFPPMFCKMTLVGEKTGTLEKTLLNVVDFYQKEVDRTVNNLLSILEPVLILFLGLVVAGLMASILLPLYNVVVF